MIRSGTTIGRRRWERDRTSFHSRYEHRYRGRGAHGAAAEPVPALRARFYDHWAGTARGDLDARGLFPDYPFTPFWTDPACEALLLRIDDAPAGFALIDRHGHCCQPVDGNIAEFFVTRKYRRSGVGTHFAHAVLERRPGIWEAAIARRNIGALAFWRAVVRICPRAGTAEEANIASPEWNGPVLRFVIRPV